MIIACELLSGACELLSGACESELGSFVNPDSGVEGHSGGCLLGVNFQNRQSMQRKRRPHCLLLTHAQSTLADGRDAWKVNIEMKGIYQLQTCCLRSYSPYHNSLSEQHISTVIPLKAINNKNLQFYRQ